MGKKGAKEFLSHRDPPFLLGRRKEESRGAIVGVINWEAHTNVYVGLRAQPKEELLLGQARLRRKGTVSHLKVMHRTTPRKRISIKKEKEKERHENI